MSEAAGPAPTVSIEAPRDVETIVFDHRYNEVGRGTGSFTLALEPGLYKYKFRRATRFVETFGSVEAGETPLVVRPPAGLRLDSSAPLAVSEGTDERVWRGARDTSLEVHGGVGAGSQLLVFLREQGGGPCDPKGVAPPDLSLLAKDGTTVWNYRRRRGHPPGACPWWGYTLSLDPGAYRLRLRTQRWGPLEQTVLAHEGWQTQVFLARHRDSGVLLSDAAILLARIGAGFDPESEALKLAESVRLALGRGQTRMAVSLAKGSSESIVGGPRGNPLLGVLVAHALRLAAEARPGETKFPDAAFDGIVSAVERSIGRHPDLDVLLAYLGRLSRSDVDPDVPPMLLVSYGLIRRMAAKDPEWMDEDSRRARIAGALWGSGPWLIWRAADAEPHGVAEAEGAVREPVGSLEGLDPASALAPENAVDSAIVSYLEGLQRAQRLPPTTSGTPRPPPRVAMAAPPPGSPPAPAQEPDDALRRIARDLALPRTLVRSRLKALLRKLPPQS